MRGVRPSSKVVLCIQDILNTNNKAPPARFNENNPTWPSGCLFLKFVRKIIIPDIPGSSASLPDTERNLPVSCTGHQISWIKVNLGVFEGNFGIFGGSMAKLYF